MKKIDQLIRDYARLVVENGVCLYAGQCLKIKTGYDTYWFAQAIAQYAYEKGAQFVHIAIDDLQLVRKRIETQTEQMLAVVPDYLKQADYEMLAKDWAYVRIDNTEDRHWLSDAPPERLGAYKTAVIESSKIYSQSLMRHEHPWCVVCAPGNRWAKTVVGEGAVQDDLWPVLAPILRLDTDDPCRAWREHAALLNKRCEYLTALQIDSLQFTSEHTNFTIGFRKEHRWAGGGDLLPNGNVFLPNIPTEEVFTTPDRLTANGQVTTTRPFSVMDAWVEDATFIFKDGKVTSYTARVGQDLLDRFFAIDEGASYIGEVALVDEASPIAQTKKVFSSILYDENASCHLALGSGYPSCLTNAKELYNEQLLLQAGCNSSLVHMDFMIGSDDMDISATTRAGNHVPIMRAGRFVQ